jgi:hypothetical protein|tara:strand:+ start:101 stop:1474 length:1374 start_codon:yes stop_codon:yes gene_type:complete
MSIAICRTVRLPDTDAEAGVRPASTAIRQTMEALCAVTQHLPIGTNLGLLHFLWMQVSGKLLPHRGAIFPSLQAIGLLPGATRRAWAAFRYGSWEIADLLSMWEAYVQDQGHWQAASYEGYKPVAVDLTAYWRPTLRGWLSKHYHALAGKALPAVVIGIIARVGRVQDQRVAIPTELVRADPDDPSEAHLQRQVIRQAAKTLAEDEIPVLDAGFKISQLQEADLSRYVVRLAKNFTARRNELPPTKGRGRPAEYGKVVRPLSRTRKKRRLPATPPDRTETWIENNMLFRAEFWDHLVLPEVKVHKDNPTFTVAAIYDPRFQDPWLLACPLLLSGTALRGLYRDRWPVEQVPLAAKQMLGGARQFVSAPESCHRLCELNLLAGAITTYLAATLPAVSTGFWDRQPKPTPGRLRRLLARTPFPQTYTLPEQLRKKNSVSDHLPKGFHGHWRTKQAARAG